MKEVVQIFRNVTTEWVHVTVNGEEIVCTPTHPFYSPAKGWISAGELKKGDILLTAQNEFVSVGKIDVEELETPEITYNFEVEGFHTYFVGENAVLVHNMCAKKADIKQIEDIAKQFDMDPATRRAFGDYVESLKYDLPNNHNFTWKELIEIAKEFLGK